MENDLNNFLNRKEIPTHTEIINFFFKGVNKDSIYDGEETEEEIDFEELGEADEVRTESGTEWIATRLCWNTDDGKLYKINLIKITHKDGELPLDAQYSTKPIYPYGREIIDVDYEDVEPLTFIETLDKAIEEEDFEEAARLRDWNAALTKLLQSLKPKIIKAIDEDNVKALEDLLSQIKAFRNTL